MSLTKVAVIGANGNLGPSILQALIKSTNPTFDITVLTRESSKSSYPPSVTVTTIPDDLPHDALTAALQQHEALVIAISGSQTDISLKVIAAAEAANVQRIIPADYGSCDSSDPRSLALLPLYEEKKKVRDHLIASVARMPSSSPLSWTSIVCGHFLDYGLACGLMGIDVEARTARVFDGGDIRFSASMLRTVGAAVVGILTHPAQTRDRIVYVHSLSTTQNELVRAVESVLAKGTFTVEHWNSDDFIREKQAALRAKPDDHVVVEELVSVEGMVNADWLAKENFVNGLFGLEDEKLEDVVRESLAGVL